MFARFILKKDFSLFQNVCHRLLSSILSKKYICDSSIIEVYLTNEKLKAIIDRQEHQFYYYADKNLHQEAPPPVFKPISTNSSPPENCQYLTK